MQSVENISDIHTEATERQKKEVISVGDSSCVTDALGKLSRLCEDSKLYLANGSAK
jgi:hypothetical protein